VGLTAACGGSFVFVGGLGGSSKGGEEEVVAVKEGRKEKREREDGERRGGDGRGGSGGKEQNSMNDTLMRLRNARDLRRPRRDEVARLSEDRGARGCSLEPLPRDRIARKRSRSVPVRGVVRVAVHSAHDPFALSATAEAAAAEAAADGVDRSQIERNLHGCEEPHSADPELWNVDHTEVDMLVMYKLGRQLWYLQSRMREDTAATDPKPIAGYPINKKAVDARRYYKRNGVEFNQGSTNFDFVENWKKIEAANPPVVSQDGGQQGTGV